MKASIKIKFSAFLAALLMLTVLIFSILILKGVSASQKERYEAYLSRQAETAGIYFLQTLLQEEMKIPERFLSRKGEELADSLALLTGLPVSLYDPSGNLVSRNIPHMQSEEVMETLKYAVEGKTAYLVLGDALYYLSPLRMAGEEAGIVSLYYSLHEEISFYEDIRTLLIYGGAAVFILSFILAYYYFSTFAEKIIRLNRMVAGIKKGHYETEVLKRKDEMGDLSLGISQMGQRIKETIAGMEEEEKKLSQAVKRLEVLDRQKKDFIGSVTHEFKTPLTSIKAHLDLLDMYPDDEALLLKARKNIESDADSLYEMVEKVLRLSASEKYDFEYHQEDMDLSAFIKERSCALKGKMDRFGLVFHSDLQPVRIKGDRESMGIILLNLLDNAIKYNRPGGSIYIKTYKDGQDAVMEIKDTGIGIPHDLKEKIFEPYFTADRNRSRENGGVGLGLSLAARYAKIQNGTLSLLNTGPEGTSFRLRFPALSKENDESGE